MVPAHARHTLDESVLSRLARRLERPVADGATPGINAAALVDDAIAWRQSVGRATLAPDQDMTPRHAQHIGSITKLFTAHAILMLRDEGKLGLDDSVATFIPEFSMPGAHTRHAAARPVPRWRDPDERWYERVDRRRVPGPG